MDTLTQEKQRLHTANYTNGRQTTELIDWVERFGYVKAAGLASLSRLRKAVLFSYRHHAHEIHKQISALVALRAVEFVEAAQNGYQPSRTTKAQAKYLQNFYDTHLSEEQKAWCREKLAPAAVQTTQPFPIDDSA